MRIDDQNHSSGVHPTEQVAETMQVRNRGGLKAARWNGRRGRRRSKLTRQRRAEVLHVVSRGDKTETHAGRPFNVRQSSISRLLARVRANGGLEHAKERTNRSKTRPAQS